MSNPFDNKNGSFFVLVDDEGQHSWWPAFAMVPEGWIRVHGPAGRPECLAFVEKNWTDLRPKSLIEEVGA